jgi:beta-glucosidase
MPIAMPIEKGATRAEQEERIESLLRELSLDEKIFMLSGHGFFESMADGGRYCGIPHPIGAGNERLGVPHLCFDDGPRGVALGESTCFPVPMARGASFDVDLERRIGDAIGRELRAQGANLFGGVCINLLRHPAWGRAQETYGEDPFLLGEMGAALVRGVQHHNVVATPKHFAANSTENARFTVDVRIAERPLREVYLPHFKRCIDAGAGAVMSAYNRLNGHYCGHNPELLTTILKEEWGFDGYVYSDFVLGCRGPDACAAGLDVEAPDTIHYGAKLRTAVEAGEVAPERIDDAVRRVLRSLFRVLAAPDPEAYGPEQVVCDAHVTLAREASEKSLVLLRNEGVLPWRPEATRRVLVLGRLADEPNLGDHGSSRVYPPRVVTPLAGLRAGAPEGCEILFDPGDDLARLRERAADADAVLVVAGYTHEDEGEFIPAPMADPQDPTKTVGGDRLDLGLGAEQETLILAATEANPRTTVAVMAGSAVVMEAWRERVGAILMLWYPGMEGGHALADVLFGRVSPSGRLPFTMPRLASDLPDFDRDATSIEYDLWHGYTKLEHDGVAPAFPFGFGLSYTTFAYTDASAADEGETIRVEVDVTNTGDRFGETVVQVYAGRAEPSPEHPRRRLCGFRRLGLEAGARERVAIDVATRDLAWFDADARHWRLGAPAWRLRVGPSSAEGVEVDVALPERRWTIRER